MIEGRHYQNAYVTRDLDKAVEAFKSRSDFRSVMQFEATTDVWTPEGKSSQTIKLAFIWVNDLQYELIEPVAGAVSIYQNELPDDDTPKFHHICMRVDDWDDFRDCVDQQSFPVVLEGGNEDLKFIYIDARNFLGHYLEYTWMSEKGWAQIGGR